MKRIETEYGVAYIGEPDELEQFDDGRLLSGEVTKSVGEDKWLDTDKHRASWPLVCVVALGFMIGGFFIGLILMGDPDFRLTGFITIIALGIALRYARRELINYESAYIEMLHEARREEIELLAERKAADNRQVKILDAAKKAQIEVNKEAKYVNQVPKAVKPATKTSNTFLFTSDDFDSSAHALLLPPIKRSRKKSLKVSGQGLIEIILKGMK